MPEPDKLEKLIQHRKQQEKKNDKIRIHKNKIENDRLRAKSASFEWYKELRQREFQSLEGEYMRKLERIYDRQMQIEDARRKVEEKKEEIKQIKIAKREFLESNNEMQDRERRKQMHGIKQERVKSFMSKARMLSTGYRDNDPPQAYYRRNGIVPPDRFVTPEMTANAQASFGGGSRRPASSEHLYRANMLPRETPFGVSVPEQQRRDSVRSRADSVLTRSDRLSVTTMEDDLTDDDVLIDEVIRVQVKLRPSTAPGKRHGKAGDVPKKGIITEVDNEEHSSDNEDVEERRPATASATVRFTDENENNAVSRRKSTTTGNTRRRASLRPQNMMMFRRRSQSSGGSTGTPGGGRSTSSTPRRGQRGAQGHQQLMSNVEQERIRRKMREKAICLESERIRRAYIAENGLTPKGRRPASASPRLMAQMMAWRTGDHGDNQTDLVNTKRRRTNEHSQAMLKYMKRCERGEIFGDSLEAQGILLETTQKQLERLRTNVEEFVKN